MQEPTIDQKDMQNMDPRPSSIDKCQTHRA